METAPTDLHRLHGQHKDTTPFVGQYRHSKGRYYRITFFLSDFPLFLEKTHQQNQEETRKKINEGLVKLPSLDWYVKRCQLIKKYFGDLTGTELKEMQYEHPEYRKTNWNELIQDIENRVRVRFANNYKNQL